MPAGIDEPMHYVRALGIGQSDLFGRPARSPSTFAGNWQATYMGNNSSRAFRVPAALAPGDNFSCVAKAPKRNGACFNSTLRCKRYQWNHPCTDPPSGAGQYVWSATYVGKYEPTTYVVPGVLTRFATRDEDAMRLARFGTVLVGTVFLLLAGLLVGRGIALCGLLAALTPMAVYLNSVVNANGGEVMAAICFAAAIMRLTRTVPAPPWVWIVMGLSAGFLATSRALGPVWLVVGFALGAWLLRGRLVAVLRSGGRGAAFGIAVAAAGALGDLGWWALVGRPRSYTPASQAVSVVLPSIDELPRLIVQQIGVFGWLDTPMGFPQYATWIVMGSTLLVLALLASRWWERSALILLCAGALGLTIAVTAVTWVTFGLGPTGMEGRYMLPVSGMVVVLGAELIDRNRVRLGDLAPRRLPLYFGFAAAATQFAAFWLDSRRYAVGTGGSLFFLRHSAWSPPLGWVTWLTVAFAGCLLLVAAAVVGGRVTPESTADAMPA